MNNLIAKQLVEWARAYTMSGRDHCIPQGLIDTIASARAVLEAEERTQGEPQYLFKVQYTKLLPAMPRTDGREGWIERNKVFDPQLLSKDQLVEQWPSVGALLPDPTAFEHHWHMQLVIDAEQWDVRVEGIASYTLEQMEAANDLSSLADNTAHTEASAASASAKRQAAKVPAWEGIATVSWKRGRAQPLRVLAVPGTNYAAHFLNAKQAQLEVDKLSTQGIASSVMKHGPGCYVRIDHTSTGEHNEPGNN